MAVDGTWNITINSPMGAREATLSLAANGDVLTGSVEGADGNAAVENGKVDGDSLTWSTKVTNPMPLTLEFTGKVDGDSISGSVKLGAFGSASFSGSRA